MKKRQTILYEFYKLGDGEEFQGSGSRILGGTSITAAIDSVPTMNITIPLEDLPESVVMTNGEPNLALYLIKVYVQTEGIIKYKFVGTIDSMSIDYANYTISLSLSHRVARMREWLMPAGFACKNMELGHLIGKEGIDLGYSSTMGSATQTYDATVEFEFTDEAEKYPMEMSFSCTDKLSALNEIIKNTHDLHYMVDLNDGDGDKIIIGKFGGESGIVISSQPFYEEEGCEERPANHITMLTEPQYAVDYTNHFNRAAVFCGDIAEGVLHFTLKEVYDNPDYQKEIGTYINRDGKEVPMFPVGMYDKEVNLQPETEWKESENTDKYYNTTKINNEKIYENYDIVAYSINDNREYFVTDAQQLEEDGVILHTVYNFTDLHPIPELEEEVDIEGSDEKETIEHPITDNDRWEISKRAYLRAIRALKSQRPEKVWQFNATPLPVGFQIGSMAELYYIKKVRIQSPDCEIDGNLKEVARINKSFYVTSVTMSFDEEVNEINTITLDNELRYRDTAGQYWELSGRINGDGDDSANNFGHIHQDVWNNNLRGNY